MLIEVLDVIGDAVEVFGCGDPVRIVGFAGAAGVFGEDRLGEEKEENGSDENSGTGAVPRLSTAQPLRPPAGLGAGHIHPPSYTSPLNPRKRQTVLYYFSKPISTAKNEKKQAGQERCLQS